LFITFTFLTDTAIYIALRSVTCASSSMCTTHGTLAGHLTCFLELA